MDTQILKEFLSYLNKSAVLGGQDGQIQNPQITTGINPPREGAVDMVNNSTVEGISNPSHGQPMGAPAKARPINFKK